MHPTLNKHSLTENTHHGVRGKKEMRIGIIFLSIEI
jgi:hypothetical protein